MWKLLNAATRDDRDAEDAALRETQEGKGYRAGGREREEMRDELEDDDAGEPRIGDR